MTTQSDAPEQVDNLAFKHREWTAQRIGWVAMLLIFIGALAGVFSVGPLSNVSAGSASDLSVAYQRFVRFRSPTALELEVGPDAVQDGRVEVLLSSQYLSGVEIEHITPEPESQETSAEGLTFTFAVGEALPAPVVLRVTPSQVGPHSGEIRVPGGAVLELSQFVLP